MGLGTGKAWEESGWADSTNRRHSCPSVPSHIGRLPPLQRHGKKHVLAKTILCTSLRSFSSKNQLDTGHVRNLQDRMQV